MLGQVMFFLHISFVFFQSLQHKFATTLFPQCTAEHQIHQLDQLDG
jgi:hypothetical protein